MERLDGKQVGVVDDGDDGLALGILCACLGDEARLAFAVAAAGIRVPGPDRAGAGGWARSPGSVQNNRY